MMRNKLLIAGATFACTAVPHPTDLAQNTIVEIVSAAKTKHEHDGHPIEEDQGPLKPTPLSAYGLEISGRWIPFPGTTLSFFATDVDGVFL